MENPCLTFVTPTLLAGDRSLSNVIAHEIAHSWTGNLVGCATWEHFWLNEGFTVFVERKILGRVFGEGEAQHSASTGYDELAESVKTYGEDHEYTKLVQQLEGDPDDAFSKVPYEKGFNFLYYLEGVVGGPAIFEPFFKAWVATHSHMAVTSHCFRAFFDAYFAGTPSPYSFHPKAAVHTLPAATLDQINWEGWYTAPGMPIVTPTFDSSLADAAIALAETWVEDAAAASAAKGDTSSWSTGQWVSFLATLLNHKEKGSLVTADTVERLETAYNLSASRNSEIRFRWQRLQLRVGRPEVIPEVIKFATEQGRMKFVRPLFRELRDSSIPRAKEMALEAFNAHRAAYHPITAKMVAQDLGC
mmetsp:Transcript_41722/g.98100  ORF Transcript_41722/g.98100 Transcript_41722/m.98100 type:complete len:360 (+) Transcript_41722:16-1095(+)